MASALITMLNHLEGPSLIPEDIDWVSGLPAGKGLLDFLTSQAQGGDVASSLRETALEKEELEL